jgi:WD40 repeat protein
VQTLKCAKTLEGHEDNVRVLAVGDAFMFSGSWDKTIRVWDLDTLDCIKSLEGHTEAVLALAVGECPLPAPCLPPACPLPAPCLPPACQRRCSRCS